MLAVAAGITPAATGLSSVRWSRSGDGIALGLHALRIGDVVALLHRRRLLIGLVRAIGRTAQKADAGADGGAHPGIAGRGAEQRAGGRTANGGRRGRAGGAAEAGLRGLVALVLREVAAHGVIILELGQRFVWTGHDGDRRPRGHGWLTAGEGKHGDGGDR
jgi:hypothetical protein